MAAILAADVAGYSRLIGLDEEGTLAALQRLRRKLIDPTIAAYRGRVVKTTGDGCWSSSPAWSMRCAVLL
jgi:adenylate cyclase